MYCSRNSSSHQKSKKIRVESEWERFMLAFLLSRKKMLETLTWLIQGSRIYLSMDVVGDETSTLWTSLSVSISRCSCAVSSIFFDPHCRSLPFGVIPKLIWQGKRIGKWLLVSMEMFLGCGSCGWHVNQDFWMHLRLLASVSRERAQFTIKQWSHNTNRIINGLVLENCTCSLQHIELWELLTRVIVHLIALARGFL